MTRLRAASLFLGPLAFGLRLWLRALGVIRDPVMSYLTHQDQPLSVSR